MADKEIFPGDLHAGRKGPRQVEATAGSALSQAFYWALGEQERGADPDADLIAELYGYAAQDGLPTEQIDRLYEYALDETTKEE